MIHTEIYIVSTTQNEQQQREKKMKEIRFHCEIVVCALVGVHLSAEHISYDIRSFQKKRKKQIMNVWYTNKYSFHHTHSLSISLAPGSIDRPTDSPCGSILYGLRKLYIFLKTELLLSVYIRFYNIVSFFLVRQPSELPNYSHYLPSFFYISFTLSKFNQIWTSMWTESLILRLHWDTYNLNYDFFFCFSSTINYYLFRECVSVMCFFLLYIYLFGACFGCFFLFHFHLLWGCCVCRRHAARFSACYLVM